MTVAPMSDRKLPCSACGIESWDVEMTLVLLPEEQRREVTVFLPVDHRINAPTEAVVALELYASEPRCKDRAHCRERVASFQLTALSSIEPDPGFDMASFTDPDPGEEYVL